MHKNYNIKLAQDTIVQSELESLTNWILSGAQLTKGPLTVEFERKFSEYIGCKYSVFVNSGSSANLLMAYALLEGGYLKNKKVIVPAISWITTLSPFMQLGFEPILCDADNKDLGLDLEHFERLCKEENPALVILVHVLGHPNKMDEIKKICQQYNVLIIEDACEALGTTYKRNKTGNIGLAGSFSFYYGHHISTIEGGMVTTNDNKLYNIMLSIRSHGWARDVEDKYKQEWSSGFNIDDVRAYYSFYFPGYNLRSTDLSAFLGLSQLQKLNDISEHREKIYNLYKDKLSKEYWFQESTHDNLSAFAYGMFVENRLEVFQHLKKNNIETRPLICGSMGLQPFWIKAYGKTNLPVADVVHEFGIYLPIHFNIDEDQVNYVCEKVKEVARPKFLKN
jgi:CDP-6-deoxy-D-xylo-4-hexulose-3-dehydrase